MELQSRLQNGLVAWLEARQSIFETVCRLGIFIYLLFYVRFQGDPHHDGYILGSAAAVAEGLSIHSEAFSQYGPVSAWIAGWFLDLTSVSILNLRILAAIFMFLVYLLLCQILQHLDFTRFESQIFSISWILINHVTSTDFPGAFFFWPSLVSTFFLMISLNFLLKSELNHRTILFPFVSGMFIAFAVFTRVQSILVILILVVLRAFLIRELDILVSISLGMFFGSAIVLSYLAKQGALSSFIEQVIVWPTTFVSTSGRSNYNLFQFALYLTLPFACLIYFSILAKINSKFNGVQKVLSVTVIGVILFMISQASGKLLRSDENVYVRLALGDQFNRIIFWPVYFCFASTVFYFLFLVFKKNSEVRTETNTHLYAIVFGVSVTPQIFPQPDIAHLWWITPLLISPTLLVIRKFQGNLDKIFYPLAATLIAALISSLVYIQRDWSVYSYQPLQGTYANKIKVESVKIYEPLTQFLHNNKKDIVFLCHDGLHAIADKSYDSIDKWFVNWGPIKKLENSERLNIASYVVVCDQDATIIKNIADKYNMSIVQFDQVISGDTYRSLAILKKAN
jgi:hypothetical protein